MPYIIRTSDRGTFKKCRQQWDFGSKIRMNYEPNAEGRQFAFGTAVHSGLENYYDPMTWGNSQAIKESIALAAFLEALPYLEHLDHDEWEQEVELGKGMLTGYFDWSLPQDNFTPVYTEIEFEVPVIWDMESDPPSGFEVYPNQGNALYYKGEPVVYQGRIDLIVQDEYGKYWIWDHKTAKQAQSTEFLQMDEQCGSYAWAIQQMLGIKVEGVVYNELIKSLPHPPKVLKSGALSTDKSQNTTYKLYMQALQDNGQHPDAYSDILDYFKQQPNKFFRRTQVHRNQEELKRLGNTIALEAVDMLNSPSIYPNPSKFTCGNCAFKTPCLIQMENNDPHWMLNELFHVRS